MTFSNRFLEQDREISIILSENGSSSPTKVFSVDDDIPREKQKINMIGDTGINGFVNRKNRAILEKFDVQRKRNNSMPYRKKNFINSQLYKDKKEIVVIDQGRGAL